jgi:hypothetical protein
VDVAFRTCKLHVEVRILESFGGFSAERVDRVSNMLDQFLEYFQFQEDSKESRLMPQQ